MSDLHPRNIDPKLIGWHCADLFLFALIHLQVLIPLSYVNGLLPSLMASEVVWYRFCSRILFPNSRAVTWCPCISPRGHWLEDLELGPQSLYPPVIDLFFAQVVEKQVQNLPWHLEATELTTL